MVRPAAALASQASRLAWTTFATYVKSRDCSPSPYTVGGVPLITAALNRDSTPEYGDPGSCRGPKTLKYRVVTVSKPYSSVNMRQYCSPTSFCSAYGDFGRV